MISRFRFHSSLAATLVLVASAGRAAEPLDAFLEKHCLRCHGPEKEKGDLQIDRFSRHDLLGVGYDPAKTGELNEDTRWHGFERIGPELSPDRAFATPGRGRLVLCVHRTRCQ